MTERLPTTDERRIEEEDAARLRRAQLRLAERLSVDARMVATQLQPHTVDQKVQQGAAVIADVDYSVIVIDVDGQETVERSVTRTLRNKRACPLVRLFLEGDISEMGLKAAHRWAVSADQYYDVPRYKSVCLDGDFSAAVGCHDLNAEEYAITLKKYFLGGCGAMSDVQLQAMNAVLRYDKSSNKVGAALFPKITNKLRASARVDGILISACEVLAKHYGFES